MFYILSFLAGMAVMLVLGYIGLLALGQQREFLT